MIKHKTINLTMEQRFYINRFREFGARSASELINNLLKRIDFSDYDVDKKYLNGGTDTTTRFCVYLMNGDVAPNKIRYAIERGIEEYDA